MPFLPLLMPVLGKYGLYIALICGALVTTIMWDRSRINAAVDRGVTKEKVRVEKTGRKNAKEASDARATAERDPMRVLREWQRD